MKPDWNYTFSILFALVIFIMSVDAEPRFQMFGFFCAGAMVLRANTVSIVEAIRDK